MSRRPEAMSGVASPGGVIEVLDMLKVQPVVIVGIIDASEFTDAFEADVLDGALLLVPADYREHLPKGPELADVFELARIC